MVSVISLESSDNEFTHRELAGECSVEVLRLACKDYLVAGELLSTELDRDVG